MKQFQIKDREQLEELIEKMCNLYGEKGDALIPIWEAWRNARKERNEIGYAMSKLLEARETGVINSKTQKTIEKYFPQDIIK